MFIVNRMAYKVCKYLEIDIIRTDSDDSNREKLKLQISTARSHSPEVIPPEVRDTPADILKRLGYKMGKTIGTGSFSKVKIVEMLANPEVKMAAKIMSLKSTTKDFVRKFLPREIQILEKIKHPFIVKVHRIIKIGNNIYVFMDLAETDLLSYILSNSSTLPQDEAQRYFSHIVNALLYLHQKNIGHRDLKCENVLLFPNQVAKLSDFGLAKEIDFTSHHMSKTFCGSRSYAAPEIASGIPYDPRSCDVWSLGCILFILLTRCMPFSSKNLTTMLQNQQNKVISFPHKFNKYAKHLIKYMLEPNVKKRIRIEDVSKHPWMGLKF
ncbi:hypothetical protein CHUAL_012545 [Chamberlinius hualienensis]